jgi:hypothetical protein
MDKKIVLLQLNYIEMIKVCDRVKFMNDVGGGKVTGFIGKSMVKVENADGFEVPYPISQLVNVDDPALNRREPSAMKAPVEKSPPPVPEKKPKGQILAGKDSPDFYFCIVPTDSKNPVGGDIRLYLVNDSNFMIMFRYGHFTEGFYKTVLQGLIQPNSREKLETLGQNDLSELPEYFFQVIYYREKDKTLNPAVVKKFRINPVKFYKEKSFYPNAYFKRHAMVLQITENILDAEIDKLTEDDFKKVVKAKEKQPDPQPENIRTELPEQIEVDLHIHELMDNPAGLSNKEILDIQMAKVEIDLQSAIRSRAKRIIFIHGVGQGVLKQEISKFLKSKYPKYAFQDASFKEYGFGATMVILRKK